MGSTSLETGFTVGAASTTRRIRSSSRGDSGVAGDGFAFAVGKRRGGEHEGADLTVGATGVGRQEGRTSGVGAGENLTRSNAGWRVLAGGGSRSNRIASRIGRLDDDGGGSGSLTAAVCRGDTGGSSDKGRRRLGHG